MRSDGVTLGFVTHDADIWFDGVLHRAAPGLLPSAIRRSADLEADSAEVEGALAHDAISSADLGRGRYDGARVVIGLVDWSDPTQTFVLYRGTIGTVSEEGGKFTAALVSRKAELQRDPVPRTSPVCRAVFCGPGCNLSPVGFSHATSALEIDLDTNSVRVEAALDVDLFAGGQIRWLDGQNAGAEASIVGTAGGKLLLSAPIESDAPGQRVLLREGCDRTLATCSTRFGNAINFRGEPHLPGNDMIARYPSSS